MTEQLIRIPDYPHNVTDFGSCIAACKARDNAYEEHGDRTPIAGTVIATPNNEWIVQLRAFPNYTPYYL